LKSEKNEKYVFWNTAPPQESYLQSTIET